MTDWTGLTRRRFMQVSAAGLVGGCAGPQGGVKQGEGKSAAEGQHAQIGVKDQEDPNASYKRTTHPEAQWFPKARLGLFVHWGISSVHGGIDISWGMMKDTPWDRNGVRATPNEYWALADRFNPDKYDPGKWLAAAKSFGCRYAVMTTRHHDGYAMWPSKYGDFGTRTHMGGRDLVRPFVEACRAEGLKVGLYFSPPDWHYARKHMSFRYGRAEGPTLGLDHEERPVLETTPEFWAEQRRQIHGQVEELLTQYGRIDLLWFDGGAPEVRESASVDWVRSLQPQIVVNPRLWGVGDFETPECRVPEKRPAGWWEMCHSWHANGWGYNRAERYKSTECVLDLLAKAATWGGNLLINVSPRPDGTLPGSLYAKMAEGADWMKTHGKAIFESEAGPYPERCNVPVTVAPGKWYVFVGPGYTGAVTLKGVDKPASVKLMGSGQEVAAAFANGELSFKLAGNQRNKLMDVAVVQWS